ncbi:hypothetical protein MLD38_037250 [Melastoma candidum]|uniref:Uncharacterized protein n=1 Tax=Melastoma candidum TaxID=119954 RepID=A0ACB9LP05_9MYRT|nr:hypothetical protein MLD38_037250 [Melastoma candidum]
MRSAPASYTTYYPKSPRPCRTLISKSITPRVAFFPSRGPNYVAPAILKPDITAPGVNIFAAVPSIYDKADNGYAILSGTSMSTPHVAGIVAILKSLHPDWSRGAIRSAMGNVYVAAAMVYRPLPYPLRASLQKRADPFDMGGGIVDPRAAEEPGLIYDMSLTD